MCRDEHGELSGKLSCGMTDGRGTDDMIKVMTLHTSGLCKITPRSGITCRVKTIGKKYFLSPIHL